MLASIVFFFSVSMVPQNIIYAQFNISLQNLHCFWGTRRVHSFYGADNCFQKQGWRPNKDEDLRDQQLKNLVELTRKEYQKKGFDIDDRITEDHAIDTGFFLWSAARRRWSVSRRWWSRYSWRKKSRNNLKKSNDDMKFK